MRSTDVSSSTITDSLQATLMGQTQINYRGGFTEAFWLQNEKLVGQQLGVTQAMFKHKSLSKQQQVLQTVAAATNPESECSGDHPACLAATKE